MLYQLSYASDESRSRSIALTLMPGTKQFKLPQRLIDVQGRVIVFIVFSGGFQRLQRIRKRCCLVSKFWSGARLKRHKMVAAGSSACLLPRVYQGGDGAVL